MRALARLAPTDHATKPPWEACLQANGNAPGGIRGQGRFPRQWATKPLGRLPASQSPTKGRVRQQAGLPQIMLQSRRGKLACKRMATPREAFAAKAASRGNGLRSRLGVCPRANPPPKAAFASKLVSHRSCYKAAVGSLLASEWQRPGRHSRPRPLPAAMGYEAAWAFAREPIPHQRPRSPASWSPTDHATKPPWEACLQANQPIIPSEHAAAPASVSSV